MKLASRIRPRVASVLLLALTVSLGPMARPMADRNVGDRQDNGDRRDGVSARPLVDQTPGYSVAGVLTARGNVTVNDNLAPTGTTVLSGSAVATGGDGIASIDLGPKGLIEMRTDTKILLNVPPEQIEVELHNCGTLTQSVPDNLRAHVKIVNPHTIRIYVTVGAVQVRFKDRKETATVSQFEEKNLDDVSDINAAGNAVFTIDCNRRPAGLWWIPTSLAGLAALAAGVSLTRDKHPPSPPNPVPSPLPSSQLSPP